MWSREELGCELGRGEGGGPHKQRVPVDRCPPNPPESTNELHADNMNRQFKARKFVSGQPHFRVQPPLSLERVRLPLLNSNHYSPSPRFGDLTNTFIPSDNWLPPRRGVASCVLRSKLGQVGLPLSDREPRMLEPNELRGDYVGAEHN